MPLIKCPECNQSISEFADSCPNCGYPIKKFILQKENEEKQKHLKEHAAITKQELVNSIKNNPILLDGVISSAPTHFRPHKGPLLPDARCVYEYYNHKLWISFCTGYLTDNPGCIDEGYICWRCYEAYIDDNGYIRRVSDNAEFGNIKNVSLDCKVDNLRPHPYPYSQNTGCYIATAIYGSYDCPKVWTLRRYRDKSLNTTWHGKLFIKFYYSISPIIVKYLGNKKWFIGVVKPILNKFVEKLKIHGV